MRPEVERPELGENEVSGKSELGAEFERAAVNREGKAGKSGEITEMISLQEISEQTAIAVAAVDIKPGSERH
jgi:hypothetical protein